MHYLIITQVFYPDTAATAQFLSDLADELSERGHRVTVFTSRFNYEDTAIKYAAREKRNNIYIKRIHNTGFGKGNVIGRVIDIFSFNFLLLINLLFISPKKFDGIIGMTSPPLISFIGCFVARLKKIKFIYWTMDLQPELAIATGMMRANSFAAKMFSAMGNYIFKRATLNITLDRFMKTYIENRGIDESRVKVLNLWPVLQNLYEGSRQKNPFRIQNGFDNKFVIMYSGNHSYVHPLDTLLGAALKLQHLGDILFVFVGEGVRKKEVTDFKNKHELNNIIQLPYQPRNMIHVSLAAADIQVVIMGENQTGYTHPNKIYGVMFAAKPVIYIGPEPSHVSEILIGCPGNISVNNNEVDQLADKIISFSKLSFDEMEIIGNKNRVYALQNFNPSVLKKNMVDEVVNHCQ